MCSIMRCSLGNLAICREACWSSPAAALWPKRWLTVAPARCSRSRLALASPECLWRHVAPRFLPLPSPIVLPKPSYALVASGRFAFARTKSDVARPSTQAATVRKKKTTRNVRHHQRLLRLKSLDATGGRRPAASGKGGGRGPHELAMGQWWWDGKGA